MWPAIAARIAPELLIGIGFAGQQYLQGRKSKWARIASTVPVSAGFVGAELLRPRYEDDWVEVHEAQGFDPRRWGRDIGGSPYAMGRW